jgi:hypothetical protein
MASLLILPVDRDFFNRTVGYLLQSVGDYQEITMVTVNLTVSPSEGVVSYWIAVHDVDVEMVRDCGKIDLDSPGTYILVWHFIGKPGETLGIKGGVGLKTVVEIKKNMIPAGQPSGAGVARFTV